MELLVFTEDEVHIFLAADGFYYRRRGFCCRCGSCCKGNPFTGSSEGYCPLFKWNEQGLGECTDRTHPYYLRACLYFPGNPLVPIDHPDCTYTWKKL